MRLEDSLHARKCYDLVVKYRSLGFGACESISKAGLTIPVFKKIAERLGENSDVWV